MEADELKRAVLREFSNFLGSVLEIEQDRNKQKMIEMRASESKRALFDILKKREEPEVEKVVGAEEYYEAEE